MKRIFITMGVLLGIGGLIGLISYHPDTGSTMGASSSTVPLSQTDPASPAAAARTYKDGTYNGPSVDVGYGPVQVQAVISGGRLTAVNFLQMPFDRDQSVMIANDAKPLLQREAITAQSANVDVVTGATADSAGFTQSLQAALNQA
jgi:uncharacterized protein with FMN-binding domain